MAGSITHAKVSAIADDAAAAAAGEVVPSDWNAGHDFSLTSSDVGLDFVQGTWTPVDSSGASLTLTSASGTYATIGKMVFITAEFVYPTTADTSTAVIGGLPFTSVGNKFSLTANLPSGGGAAGNNGSGSPYVVASGTTIRFSLAGSKDSDLTNTSESNRSYRISGFYLKT